MPDREFDVVVWGATGYTGRLVAERLVTEAKGAKWAIAGRDRKKLEALGLSVPILVGDAGDPRSLDAIAQRARVVCTTVGPYMKYGAELVAACVRAGTSYCDLTGETPFIKQMIDQHHDAAKANGARIVHCCGFDSIPSDLGVLLLHEEAKRRGARLAKVDGVFGESSGTFSGGTVASILNLLDLTRKDPSIRKQLMDPYQLDTAEHRGGPDKTDFSGIAREPRLGMWTAPFLMAAVNARVVRRSNALLGHAYGDDFRYVERMSTGRGAKGLALASAITAGLAAFAAGSQLSPLRKLIEQKLPSPGEGPTPEQRAKGFFVVRHLGRTTDGLEVQARVEDRRDPGYGSTAVMISEAALCLARDPLASPGGVQTPAAAMGLALVERLRAAGMTFALGS